jgi:hypothetical protein
MDSYVSDLITVASGQASVRTSWKLEDLTLRMPLNSSHDFVSTVPLQANRGTVRNVTVTGGGTASWGLNLDGILVARIEGFIFQGEGNGILIHNSNGLAYNIGDSAIENTTVVLSNPGTTGIALFSPTNNTGNNRINNMLLSRVEVQTSDGIVRDGTVGIHLRNAARITMVNVDIEHMDTGLLQESAVDGGAIATTNSFLQIFCIGCRNDYVEQGATPQLQTVIGGQGMFADMQQLPSSNILAGHPIMGNNRVLTAVRPIVAYSNSSAPRVLTVADSGKIFTNKNATGIVTFVLPPANLSNSIEYEFHLATAGNPIRVQTTSGDIIRPLQTSVNKYLQSAGGWGQVLKIRNIDNTIWSVLEMQGKWTSQP